MTLLTRKPVPVAVQAVSWDSEQKVALAQLCVLHTSKGRTRLSARAETCHQDWVLLSILFGVCKFRRAEMTNNMQKVLPGPRCPPHPISVPRSLRFQHRPGNPAPQFCSERVSAFRCLLWRLVQNISWVSVL